MIQQRQKTPIPGRAVRGSHTGRPIMALFDLLGRRWVLRILWELRDGALTFRELRGRCDEVSPTVLNQRLHDLRAAEMVELEQQAGYVLTKSGVQLLEALMPLQKWAQQWQRRVSTHAVDRESDDRE